METPQQVVTPTIDSGPVTVRQPDLYPFTQFTRCEDRITCLIVGCPAATRTKYRNPPYLTKPMIRIMHLKTCLRTVTIQHNIRLIGNTVKVECRIKELHFLAPILSSRV